MMNAAPTMPEKINGSIKEPLRPSNFEAQSTSDWLWHSWKDLVEIPDAVRNYGKLMASFALDAEINPQERLSILAWSDQTAALLADGIRLRTSELHSAMKYAEERGILPAPHQTHEEDEV